MKEFVYQDTKEANKQMFEVNATEVVYQTVEGLPVGHCILDAE